MFGKTLVLLLPVLLLNSGSALAAKFANQFVEFNLPHQWQCNLEGAEWVCQSVDNSRKRDAIVILAAKLKGDQDSLDQYLNYLKNPKSYTSVDGKPVRSEPKYSKTIDLSGQPWVDSLHLESEIPGFYTRYLATVKKDIGVLVTYSINKNKYQEYLNDFEEMVKTLKVFRKGGLGLNAATKDSSIFQNTKIPEHLTSTSVFPDMQIQGGGEGTGGSQKSGGDLPLLPILAVVALVGFIIWKRRQNQE